MSRAAEALITAFTDLAPAEQAEVLSELLRRAALEPHGALDDEDFARAASDVFLAYEQEENRPR